MAGFAVPLWSPTIGDIPIAAQQAAFPSVFPAASVNPKTTALTTVGAGTITAAGITAGVTIRTGSTSAYTDTTDTAAAIITALTASAIIGESWVYVYVNNTVAVATLAAGSGVTLTGSATVPPIAGTFTANGATPVTVSNTAVTATSQIDITLKTVGGTVSPTRPNILTITAGTGFTVGGVASDTSVYNYRILG